MFKRKDTRSYQGEKYPGGKQHLPPGKSSTPQKVQRKYSKKRNLPINFRRVQISRGLVEKLFMATIFIVLEVMVFHVFFHILDGTLNSSNFPGNIRGFLKLAQLALFIIFTYANIMASFFKVNIFQ